MKQLEDHEIAGWLDLATETELAGLADDIAKHGQIETIDLYEGKILDGRNRYRACLAAGVEPRCATWTANGVGPQDYVVAKNLHRRHLTIAQRAALAVRLVDYEREEAAKRKEEGQRRGGEVFAGREEASLQTRSKASQNKTSAAQRAADKVGVGRTSVLAAELISKKSPETFEKMKKGEISVTAAASEAGIGTGTYVKKKPHRKFTSEEIQASATAADNLHAAHFYTGLANNVIPVFGDIPPDELDELLVEADQALTWWKEILSTLKTHKKGTL